MSFSSDASSASAAVEAAAAAQKKLNLEKATNFMKQYRDPHSRELKKLSANQFMDVWSHYDKDGELVGIKKLGFFRVLQLNHLFGFWFLVPEYKT